MVLITQIGARQHYEPAVMAHRSGLLARLLTDVWNPFGESLRSVAKRLGSGYLTRYAGRYRRELDPTRVVSLSAFPFRSRLRQALCENRDERYIEFVREGRDFALACIKYTDCPHSAFFGFSSASYEMLLHEKKNGVHTVLDQIDPGPTEYLLVKDEEKRFPEFVEKPLDVPGEYVERLQQEWNEADRIIVNSDWSKTALAENGVHESKLAVVPLPFTPTNLTGPVSPRANSPRILWIGTLGLRKGLPYAIEAARILEGTGVTFTFAGPLEIRCEALRLPSNASYIGQVPRAQTADLYRGHDVFLFPTLSDGFGLTQVEALSHGLPIVTTTNCGKVVKHGECGFVVETRNARAIADAITHYRDLDVLERMSELAVQRSRDFTPEAIWPLYRDVLFPEKNSSRGVLVGAEDHHA